MEGRRRTIRLILQQLRARERDAPKPPRKSSQEKEGTRPALLVFIGHGTFDGKRAKFNLHGPDVQHPNSPFG